MERGRTLMVNAGPQGPILFLLLPSYETLGKL